VIAVDTSALMAIALQEPAADACAAALGDESEILISAVTLAEAIIVAGRRGVAGAVESLVERLALEVVPVTAVSARRVANAYERWGRGMHPAALNLGDCFAYEVAKAASCPLLFIGKDFARTDVKSVL
jgi:ribonuclease VapC